MATLPEALEGVAAAGTANGEMAFKIRALQALEAAGMIAAAKLVSRMPTAEFPKQMVPTLGDQT